MRRMDKLEEHEFSEEIYTGVSVRGTVHALRPGGTTYCESEVNLTDKKTRTWGEVTCRTCPKNKNQKRRIEPELDLHNGCVSCGTYLPEGTGVCNSCITKGGIAYELKTK